MADDDLRDFSAVAGVALPMAVAVAVLCAACGTDARPTWDHATTEGTARAIDDVFGDLDATLSRMVEAGSAGVPDGESWWVRRDGGSTDSCSGSGDDGSPRADGTRYLAADATYDSIRRESLGDAASAFRQSVRPHGFEVADDRDPDGVGIYLRAADDNGSTLEIAGHPDRAGTYSVILRGITACLPPR